MSRHDQSIALVLRYAMCVLVGLNVSLLRVSQVRQIIEKFQCVCVCVLFSHQGQDTLYVDLCSFFVAMYGFLWCALLVLIAVSLVESVSLFKCNLCLPFLPCICLFDSSKFEGRIWLFSYSREFLIRFQVSLSFLREKPSGFYQRLFDVDEPSNTIQNHS